MARPLIKYAGYDPFEDHSDRPQIDAKLALRLRETGMTWPQVARQMSDEIDAQPPYTSDGVQSAVRSYHKRGGR